MRWREILFVFDFAPHLFFEEVLLPQGLPGNRNFGLSFQ